MKVFEIIRKETCTYRVYVEANGEEEAKQYVDSLEENCWRSNHDYRCKYAKPKEIKNPKKELRGTYVERLDGTSKYGDKL